MSLWLHGGFDAAILENVPTFVRRSQQQWESRANSFASLFVVHLVTAIYLKKKMSEDTEGVWKWVIGKEGIWRFYLWMLKTWGAILFQLEIFLEVLAKYILLIKTEFRN